MLFVELKRWKGTLTVVSEHFLTPLAISTIGFWYKAINSTILPFLTVAKTFLYSHWATQSCWLFSAAVHNCIRENLGAGWPETSKQIVGGIVLNTLLYLLQGMSITTPILSWQMREGGR